MRVNNKLFRVFFFLFIYWLVLNYLVFFKEVDFFSVPDVAAVDDIQYSLSQAKTPMDLMQAQWQPVSLPDDWYTNHKNIEKLWYRSHYTMSASDADVWAVYLPSVSHNAAIYINGVWVGHGGQFDDPVSRHHNEPLLFKFSSSLLKPGDNQIDIFVKTSFHEQGLLGQFYIAPLDKLSNAYFIKHLVRVDVIQWVTIAMFVMSLVLGGFWLARPQDSTYGLFAMLLLLWALHNLNLIVSNIPFSVHLWEAMTMSTLGWTTVMMVIFNHRYLCDTKPRIEKAILFFAVLGIGIFFLPDISSILHIGYGVWDALLMVFACYTIYYLLHSYWLTQNNDAFLILLVGIPILVFGLHDVLVVNHLWDKTDGLIIQYNVIPAMFLFSWFLLRRFVMSINQAEQLAATLEQRVQEKQQTLQLQYEQLNQMEQQSVLAEERERIMRDMHDGIGGQLVSVISVLREHDGDIFSSLREKVQRSLSDLRFVIDSLDPLLNDLPTLLGMMRLRLRDQLEAEKISLQWVVTDLPEMEDLNPRRSLNVMRIVEEAITNIIKHSGADKMTLATGLIRERKQIYIDIIDYGCGMKQLYEGEHVCSRGIENMHYRAKQLDATLEISSSGSGTRVRLLLDYV